MPKPLAARRYMFPARLLMAPRSAAWLCFNEYIPLRIAGAIENWYARGCHNCTHKPRPVKPVVLIISGANGAGWLYL